MFLMNLTSLGETLREARNARSWTLRQAEENTGVSNAFLSQLEGAKIKQPSPTILHKLCETYNLSYALVLEYAGHPVPENAQFKSGEHRFLSRMGSVSTSEETALLEYLSFLRTKRK